jgi:hypothetical protein
MSELYKKRGQILNKRIETIELKDGENAKKLLFTIEEATDFKNKYQFEIFGNAAVDLLEGNIKQDRFVTVHFYIKSNEWKDRFFNTLMAKEVIPQDPLELYKDNEENNNDVPF